MRCFRDLLDYSRPGRTAFRKSPGAESFYPTGVLYHHLTSTFAFTTSIFSGLEVDAAVTFALNLLLAPVAAFALITTGIPELAPGAITGVGSRPRSSQP